MAIYISKILLRRGYYKKNIGLQSLGLLLLFIIMNTSNVSSINTVVKGDNINQENIKISGSILYPIIAVGNEGGTIAPQGKTLVNYLDNMTYTITPKTGYYVLDLLVDGNSVGPLNSYTFNEVTSNHTIEAKFAPVEYQLYIHVSGEGTVNENLAKSVFGAGESVQLTANPSPGWSFSGWSGAFNGTANPINMVFNGDKDVTATFVPISYHLKITISGSGKVFVNPSNETYFYGEEVQISAVPDSGWYFSGWGGDISGSASFPTIIIDKDKTVNATFIKLIEEGGSSKSNVISNITISASAGSGGSISPSGSVSVAQGSSQVFTITPNTGYHVSSVLVDGASVGAVSSYTFSSVQAAHTISASFTQAYAPTYTVDVEGSNYVTKNSVGTAVATNTDFGAMLTSLNSKLVSGDIVLITNGIYLTSTCPVITKTHVTFTGQGNSIIKAFSTTTPSTQLIQIYNGGSYDVLDHLIFDANFNTNISPVVLIGGSYNVVQYCELRNAIQYGIQSWKGDHFKFIYNKICKAQYGLCTGGDAACFSTNGLISNNIITDAQDCGVKLKWVKNCQITNNTIDVGYITWTTNASGSTTEGARAIDFYTDDGPDYNCTASGNHITDSRQNLIDEGIVVDTDRRLGDPSQPASYGLQINNNDISGTYYGLLIKKASEVTYSGNTFSAIRYKNIYVTG